LPEKRRRAATVSDIVVIVNGVRRAVVITAKTVIPGRCAAWNGGAQSRT